MEATESLSLAQLITLALVQGITEFLPISSSGHLILVPALTEWPDQGLMIDVAVHVGTLGAVILYMWRELRSMLTALIQWRGTPLAGAPDLCLIRNLIVSTIPILVAGLAFKEFIGDQLRSIEVIAWAMLGFGIVLYVVDKRGAASRKMEAMSVRDALVFGFFQILALIPGTSRAGITMTAGRLLGYDRQDSARFSMLMSIPTIFLAGALIIMDLIALGDAAIGSDAIIAALLALVSALVAIWLMMRWLRTATFTPFVIYRVVLGVILLLVAYS